MRSTSSNKPEMAVVVAAAAPPLVFVRWARSVTSGMLWLTVERPSASASPSPCDGRDFGVGVALQVASDRKSVSVPGILPSVELFGAVAVDSPSEVLPHVAGPRSVTYALRTPGGDWPRLLADKRTPAVNVVVDWDRWDALNDEEEDADARSYGNVRTYDIPSDAGFGNSTFGAMGIDGVTPFSPDLGDHVGDEWYGGCGGCDTDDDGEDGGEEGGEDGGEEGGHAH